MAYLPLFSKFATISSPFLRMSALKLSISTQAASKAAATSFLCRQSAQHGLFVVKINKRIAVIDVFRAYFVHIGPYGLGIADNYGAVVAVMGLGIFLRS
jgi:hypothetical protein